MAAGSTKDGWVSGETCQGVSDRLLTSLGHAMGGSSDVARTYLKLALISSASMSK